MEQCFICNRDCRLDTGGYNFIPFLYIVAIIFPGLFVCSPIPGVKWWNHVSYVIGIIEFGLIVISCSISPNNVGTLST